MKEEKKQIKCMKCSSKMITQNINGVEIEYCLKCGGMWFDSNELEKVLGGNKPKFFSELSSSGKISGYTCPKCFVYIYQMELIQGSGIIAETCFKCDGFFLDKGELVKLKDYINLNQIKISIKHEKTIDKVNKEPIPIYKQHNQPSDVYMFDVESFPVKFFQFLTGFPIEKAPSGPLLTPVTGTLIALNSIIFLYTYFFGGLNKWTVTLGMVPNEITNGHQLITILTSMFMHGSWLHLIGNMYFLFVTGDDVEKRLGSFWFTIFYFAGGIIATLGQIVVSPTSTIPHIGASGAISALMGAYVIILPKRKFFFRFFYFLWFNFSFEVPVYAYLIFWFLLQMLNAHLKTAGVAWHTHITGFLFGMLIALIIWYFKPNSKKS